MSHDWSWDKVLKPNENPEQPQSHPESEPGGDNREKYRFWLPQEIVMRGMSERLRARVALEHGEAADAQSLVSLYDLIAPGTALDIGEQGLKVETYTVTYEPTLDEVPLRCGPKPPAPFKIDPNILDNLKNKQ